jgi:hypothetical protein
MAAHFDKILSNKNKLANLGRKSLQCTPLTHPLKQSQMFFLTPLSRDISTYPMCVS